LVQDYSQRQQRIARTTTGLEITEVPFIGPKNSMTSKTIVLALALLDVASGHGYLTSPPSRQYEVPNGVHKFCTRATFRCRIVCALDLSTRAKEDSGAGFSRERLDQP